MKSEVASKAWTKSLLSKSFDYFNGKVKGYDEYSEDESVVGKWINGKPLYQKTWTMTSLGAENKLIPSLSAFDIEDLFVVDGFYKRPSAGYESPTVTYYNGGASDNIWVYRQGDTFMVHVGTGYQNSTGKIVLTIRYTKTTDAENSFIPEMLTGAEVEYFADSFNIFPNEYSEEERVVGCFIDGKPIYRKVFDVTFPASGNSSEIPFANIGIQNVADVINIYGTVLKTDGYTIIINAGTFTDSAFMDCHLSRQILWLYSKGNAGGRSGKAIVEYTKTTDAPNSYTIDMILDQYNIPRLKSIDTKATEDEVEEVLGE